MAATPTSRPILHSIAPRFGVGNLEQALAFYRQLGFATTYQDEGLAIVERDGVALHLHSSEEPPEHHTVCWIRVTNIEALYQEYQEYLPTNGISPRISPRLVAQPWGFKEFHICDPVRNLFIFGEALPEEGEVSTEPEES